MKKIRPRRNLWLAAAWLLSVFQIIWILGLSTPAQACTALPSAKGTATFTISAPIGGTYHLWAHIYAPAPGSNGFYLQLDDSLCSVIVGHGGNIPAGQFTWVDYQNGTPSNKISLTLAMGDHTVSVAGLDPGVGVDRILLLADAACVPTAAGTNCAPSATTSTVTPPANSPTQPPITVAKPNVTVSAQARQDGQTSGMILSFLVPLMLVALVDMIRAGIKLLRHRRLQMAINASGTAIPTGPQAPSPSPGRLYYPLDGTP